MLRELHFEAANKRQVLCVCAATGACSWHGAGAKLARSLVSVERDPLRYDYPLPRPRGLQSRSETTQAAAFQVSRLVVPARQVFF